jgi:hypothetical protein
MRHTNNHRFARRQNWLWLPLAVDVKVNLQAQIRHYLLRVAVSALSRGMTSVAKRSI